MAKNSVDKQFCKSCSADIREGSQFCYSCGKAVSPMLSDSLRSENSANSRKNKSREFDETKSGKPSQISEKIEVDSISKTQPAAALAAAEIQTAGNSKTEQSGKLRSAAALRDRAKVFKRKQVEVEWVEHDSSSAMFYVVSIALTLFTATLLFFALYFR